MLNEFHITFSCGTYEEGAKPAINQIQRLMKEGGAELISKNEDDGYMDIVFHHHTSPENITKLCKIVLEKFKNSHVSVSTCVYEHKPSVLIDTKDVKDPDEFKKFIESLASQQGYFSISEVNTEPNLLQINFTKSSQRQAFQNEYTAKASEYMKNGHSSVQVFPNWEDITFLQKNNYSDDKRSNKYGF